MPNPYTTANFLLLISSGASFLSVNLTVTNCPVGKKLRFIFLVTFFLTPQLRNTSKENPDNLSMAKGKPLESLYY